MWAVRSKIILRGRRIYLCFTKIYTSYGKQDYFKNKAPANGAVEEAVDDLVNVVLGLLLLLQGVLLHLTLTRPAATRRLIHSLISKFIIHDALHTHDYRLYILLCI